MFTLSILTGYCLGSWCTVSYSDGFETWADCHRERLAVVQQSTVPSDAILVARCAPTKKRDS